MKITVRTAIRIAYRTKSLWVCQVTTRKAIRFSIRLRGLSFGNF